MKKCFFVFGPESAGNRVMSRILIAAGCHGRGDTDQQPQEILDSGNDNIVIHMSFPFGARGCNRHWPSVGEWAGKAWAKGYDVQVIVMTRDTHCMIHSQIKAGHVLTTDEALSNISTAYKEIFCSLSKIKVEFTAVPYESLVLHSSETIHWLLDKLGLVEPYMHEEIKDENAKWYSFPIRWNEIIRVGIDAE